MGSDGYSLCVGPSEATFDEICVKITLFIYFVIMHNVQGFDSE